MNTREIGIAGWAFHHNILQERTLSLLDLPALARQAYGVRTIELVSEFFESQTAGYLNQLRQALATEGVRVHSIGLDHGNIAAADAAERRTSLEALKQWFYVARAIGAPAIRVNTDDFEPLVEMLVSKQPIPANAILFRWDSLSSDERQDALARSVAGYAELATLAAETQVKLLIENHGGVTGEPRNIAHILARVDSPWFVTCPDNQNPYSGNEWEAGTRTLAPRAHSVHVKIAGYEPSGMQTFTSPNGATRSQDLRRFLEIMLLENDYRGPINLEYNFAERDEHEGVRKGLDYLHELVATISPPTKELNPAGRPAKEG
jgi:sugar phosphate isomerase/epimerase